MQNIPVRKMLLKTLFFNLFCILAALWYGFNVKDFSIAISLIAGIIISSLNFFIMVINVLKATEKSAKLAFIFFYFRLAISAVLLYIALVVLKTDPLFLIIGITISLLGSFYSSIKLFIKTS